MTALTPGQARVAKATRARMTKHEHRLAELLRSRGWTCTPPPTEDRDEQ